MHQVIAALLAPRQPIDLPGWRSFWDGLHAGEIRRGEAVALLTSLATCPPDVGTVEAMLASLDERRLAPPVQYDESVNIVGTGGGPRTFNISTAAAFVGAATGLRVIKTGARAYSGGRGSFDLLEQLGIPLSNAYEETGETLDRFGLAFAGYFVYPPEVSLLARAIFPMRMREIGRFVNVLGPVLAAAPVTAQLTGVSDHGLLPTLRRLAVSLGKPRIWFCTNALGADELTGFADDLLYTADGGPPVRLADIGLAERPGTLADLRPAPPGTDLVADFLDVLAGRRGEVATRAVCLNAAALRVALDPVTGWPEAMARAEEAIRSGAALELVGRMRDAAPLAARPRVRRGG
ncbi:hypothetical protein AB0J84_20365 [Micromonospora arborensis]|uniref:anthranilate phosphoribosyltransferase n=1 Tax=Micromonospora arborensis TaxID=2116518 RepID=UPI0034146C16